MPKFGLLCYATDTGLGRQTKLLHDLMRPAKTMLVDISSYNNLPLHLDWYDHVDVKTTGFPTRQDIDSFLVGLDAVFICETPLNYYLISRANELGVATILQYNYEFFDYIPNPFLPKPTVFAGPTLWNKERLAQQGFNITHLPLPIDISVLPQRTITQARHFFHVAGRPAVHDRNGTLDFVKAVRMLSPASDVHYTVYCQAPTAELRRAVAGTRVQIVEHLPDYTDMFRHGDVMVLPRRYGGLCLPLNEAIGSGIPVLMTDVDPNNTWLPREWLVPVMPRSTTFTAHCPVELHSVNVQRLAERMNDLYRRPELVAVMHQQAKDLAASLSWEKLEPRYEEVVEEAISRARILV